MEKIKIMLLLYSEDPAEPAFSLLRGLFPVCPLCSGPGLTVLQPAPGIILQLVGKSAQPPVYLRVGTVISYAVNDLPAAIAQSQRQGAMILQEPIDDCNHFSLCYLQFPGGQVFGLFTDGNH